MSKRSRYFEHGRSSSASLRSRSEYFACSSGSFFNGVETLGSLLEVLGQVPFATAHSDCTKSASLCQECQKVIESVLPLFNECPIFRERWMDQNQLAASGSSSENVDDESPCWKRMEPHLENSVRHLCSQQCYLKAFAPYRSWFALQRSLTASPHTAPEEAILKGWKCCLSPGSRRPKVLFQDVKGKHFDTISRVVRMYETPREDGMVVKTRTRRSKRKRHDSYGSIPTGTKYPHGILAHTVRSPLGLLEELFDHDPWRLLLSTIFLNRTSRVQVDHVLFDFLARWPSPNDVVQATTGALLEVIRPLGICNRRAEGLKRFSRDYMALSGSKACPADMFFLSDSEVTQLFHCGSYAYDAYRLFIQRDTTVDPTDIALKTYVEYKLAVATTSALVQAQL